MSPVKPLEKYTLIDLTHMLSGPYGGMLLADLGMTTIKVEPPGTGEGTRRLLATDPENARHGMGAYFMTLNRNKKSVCIDLKSARGREVFYRLVERADVVLENFSPGVTRRLGIDHEALSAVNPRIVSCSVSGFGHAGPASNRPAFDMVAQGMGGGMSITGTTPGEPLRSGIPIGDLGGGIFAAMGILSALLARETTGRGQHVDISMLDGQISLLNYMATMHLLSGRNPGPEGNGHFVHVPYNAFPTATRHIIVCCLLDQSWTALAKALGLEDLLIERYERQPGRLADRALIEARVADVLATRPCEHWLEILTTARIPCAPVNDFEHALSDPQVLARNMVIEVEHPQGGALRMPGNPIKLSDTPAETFSPPPLLGQHTDEVLRDLLALAPEQVAELRREGVVA